MKESAVQFGDRRQLAGIVTLPRAGPPRGVLILASAGLTAKSGPFRVYVELARRLASAGFLTLRFDLGGVGESRVSSPGLPLRARTALEMRAAFDFMVATYGVSPVFLGGLCSGGEDSLRYAEADARVAGLVLIDPFAYRTSGWRVRHVVHRVARRSMRAIGFYQPAPPSPQQLVSYAYMDRQESTRILSVLLAREARVHFVYTGGSRESFNHEGQLQKMFPTLDLGPRVTVDHLPHMDHTQLLQEDRSELVERICQRMVG